MRRAIFLDRDGVLNKAYIRGGKPVAPSSLKELQVLPGVLAAVIEFKALGYLLIVVTNQPDVARRTVTKASVDEINAKLKSELSLDAVYCCFHDDADHCDCRKPKPGMLLQAARDYDIDLPASYMVGDRWKDIEAGRRASCKTVFIDYGYDEQRPSAYDLHVHSLLEAAGIIASEAVGA